MKRILTLLCLASLGLMLLTGCNQQGNSASIGVIDETAFQKNEIATKAMSYLQELGAPLQKKAEEAYKAMQADQNEKTTAAYKAAMGDLQNVMNGEQQRVVALLETEFNKVLDAYRAEKGLSVIVSKRSVISSDQSLDITDDIIAKMNKLELDFSKPAAPAAPAQQEAPAKPADHPKE